LDVPSREIEKVQEIYVSENHGTYLSRFIRDETRGMYLHIGTINSKNSSTLEVGCPPRRELERKNEIVLLQKTLGSEK
jgi:hypothetical protein